MLSINPCPPTRRRQKAGKGRETYELEMKTGLLMLIIREIRQNIQN